MNICSGVRVLVCVAQFRLSVYAQNLASVQNFAAHKLLIENCKSRNGHSGSFSAVALDWVCYSYYPVYLFGLLRMFPLLSAAPVTGRHSGSSISNMEIRFMILILRQMPFLTRPSVLSGLGSESALACATPVAGFGAQHGAVKPTILRLRVYQLS